MNRKIYRAVVIVLVVLTIGQIIRFGFQLYGDQYHYHYDEDTRLYSIQDGQYSELLWPVSAQYSIIPAQVYLEPG